MAHIRKCELEWRFWDKVKIREGCWLWVGYVANDGYGRFRVGAKMCIAHRVAYELMNMSITLEHEIDHICRNARCVNPAYLRPATRSQNSSNKAIRADNASGFKGVSRSGSKWQADICLNGKGIYLGHFETPEEAHATYCKAATTLFGEFACYG